MHVSAALLPLGRVVHGTIPVYTAIATVLLGVMMGETSRGEGWGWRSLVRGVECAAGRDRGRGRDRIRTSVGWPLLGAPILLAVGAAIGIVQQRRRDGYQNPEAPVGRPSARSPSVAFGAGSRSARWTRDLGQGVVEVLSYVAEYDCLDPQRARLAASDPLAGFGEQPPRGSRTLLASGDGRPCKP
jgi:hypothetical protein